MLVYFSAPFYTVTENFDVYKAIIDAIHSDGHSLSRNWLEPAFHGAKNMQAEDDDLGPVKIEQILESIQVSDAVVVDVSAHGTFGVGYLTAKALEWGKPVLALHRAGTVKGILPQELKGITYAEFSSVEEAVAVVRIFLEGGERC